jgi:hypothetical protein
MVKTAWPGDYDPRHAFTHENRRAQPIDQEPE